MYLINTSFHVDNQHRDALVGFIRSTIIPAAIASDTLSNPILLEILIEVDPAISSLSLQFSSDDLDRAMECVDTTLAPLYAEITTRCGGAEHLIHFTTPMRVLA